MTGAEGYDVLQRFGYPCKADLSEWQYSVAEVSLGSRVQWPKLDIDVVDHEEKEGHTWYRIKCSIDPVGSCPKQWELRRRLKQIREEWHDVIKHNCGWEGYYQSVPEGFASRGGLPGTTAVLATWAKGIAEAMNTGKAPPKVAHETLIFLDILREPPEVTSNFLIKFGVPVKSDMHWFSFEGPEDQWPKLNLEVKGSEQNNGQTVLSLEGSLRSKDGLTIADWETQQSLEDIRSKWSAPAASEYGVTDTILTPGLFTGSGHIASSVGEWVAVLVKGINERSIPPGALALSLRFLGAPLAPPRLQRPEDAAPPQPPEC